MYKAQRRWTCFCRTRWCWAQHLGCYRPYESSRSLTILIGVVAQNLVNGVQKVTVLLFTWVRFYDLLFVSLKKKKEKRKCFFVWFLNPSLCLIEELDHAKIMPLVDVFYALSPAVFYDYLDVLPLTCPPALPQPIPPTQANLFFLKMCFSLVFCSYF